MSFEDLVEGMFRVEAFLDNVQKRCLKVSFTAVTTNTRRRRVFFFSRALTEKVPSWQRLTRKISNYGGFFNYFIKMRDYTVKTTRPKHSLQFT